MPTAKDKFALVPEELKERNQWIHWKWKYKNTPEETKVPCNRQGTNINAHDPLNWMSFEEVQKSSKFNVAFDISPHDPFTGIDLDGCIVNGQYKDWAIEILDRFKGVAYGEISPSGTGVKLTTLASKPIDSGCVLKKFGGPKEQIECFDHDRFWAMTGICLGPGFETIGDGQEAVDWLFEKYRSQDESRTQKIPGERLPEDELRILMADWNARTTPPLDDDELETVIHSSGKNGTPRRDKFVSSMAELRQKAKAYAAATPGANEGERNQKALSLAGHLRSFVVEDSFDVFDFLDLGQGDLHRGDEIIEGVLRDGEVCFVGSVSKAGKSWFIAYLLWCVIAGRDWLGKKVKKGSVLLIDNELKLREIRWRHQKIIDKFSEWGDWKLERGNFKCVPLRGKTLDVHGIADRIARMDLSGFSLIVIDCLHKTTPEGKSENENGAMGKLMDALQGIAESTGVAVVCVHHATKGDQSYKSTLDTLAGAGAFGRSLDTMIALRDHEKEGLNVVEFITRTNAQQQPISVEFQFPIWVATEADPILRQPKGVADRKQALKDKEADEKILAVLQASKGLTRPQLRTRTGFGAERLNRAIARLEESELIAFGSRKNRKTGKKIEVVKISECTPECTPECTDKKQTSKPV